ncbi:MAG: arginine--tRNA ligase [Caldilineaceae bacterium]|nr:arginine--tRNA ligase [Caldilineaceae bacterium]
MSSLKAQLTKIVSDTFLAAGYAAQYGEVTLSNRPDLAQFQCNGALAAAKQYGRQPRQIGEEIAQRLQQLPIFQQVSLAGPGFINLIVTDAFLVEQTSHVVTDPRRGCTPTPTAQKIIVDYGGANVAKPMHVGHLRAAIIGESIKRLSRFVGHTVIGDVHLGDWGLPMGQILAELADRHPEWIYFDPAHAGRYPAESPVSITDLEEIYPTASQRTKSDEAFAQRARQATQELRQGRPGYRALWGHFVAVSVAELQRDYGDINVHFDLWLGESDTQSILGPLLQQLRAEGIAQISDGALIIPVSEPGEKREIPPLILEKSDGAVLYGTTDLATIQQRVQTLAAEVILYVVDNRQSLHFEQVFRAAHKTGIAPAQMQLEHLGFGTMNGKDGKPFKTRSGGVMKLRSLIEMITEKARERLAEVKAAQDYPAAEKEAIARLVGVATLKFADLSNQRTGDYVFDLDRFSAFEGRTGPYLLYTAARTKSILRKAAEEGLPFGPLQAPVDDDERALFLKLVELPDVVELAFAQRMPHHLCEYVYTLATTFNRFYHQHHILSETNPAQQAAWLTLTETMVGTIILVLDLLGIAVPERM